MTPEKMTIPEVRQRLYALAERLGCDELRTLADATFRRSPVRRAAPRHRPLTPELAEAIRQYAAARPGAHLSDIAQAFRVNPGRVSEALHHQEPSE